MIEALSVGTPVAVASGTSLDEITPPSAPRFSPTDGPALTELMISLGERAADESPEQCRQWAERFNHRAYRRRLAELIEELK